MGQVIPGSIDMAQFAQAQRLVKLQNQVNSGASWFFWIAGMSVLNSVIHATGSKMTFVVGLGATQFIDGFGLAAARDLGSGAGLVLQVIAFALTLCVAGIFLAFGVMGRKRTRWVIIVGMLLYALDALLLLAFGDFAGALFHGLALFGLFRGLQAINALTQLEKAG